MLISVITPHDNMRILPACLPIFRKVRVSFTLQQVIIVTVPVGCGVTFSQARGDGIVTASVCRLLALQTAGSSRLLAPSDYWLP